MLKSHRPKASLESIVWKILVIIFTGPTMLFKKFQRQYSEDQEELQMQQDM